MATAATGAQGHLMHSGQSFHLPLSDFIILLVVESASHS